MAKRIFICCAAIIIACTITLGACRPLKFSGAEKPYQPPRAEFKQPINLAIILGGGGAKGFAHVGVLEELEKAGIKPDLIVGCSVGSIVGSLYALEPDAVKLKKKIFAGKKEHIFSYDFGMWTYGVYSSHKMQEYLQNTLSKHNFSDAKIPFLVVATNLEFGNLSTFGVGDMIKPILASAAIPGAFPPVQIHGQYFVDGGVADPVPVQVAKQYGARVVIAINIAEKLTTASPNHFAGVVARSLEISYIHQSHVMVKDADVVIDFDLRDIGAFADDKNEYLYEMGKKAALKAIPLIKQKLKK